MTKTNRMLCRAAAVCLTAVLSISLSACGEGAKKEESGEDIPMEDLEYGATMRDSDDFSIPLEYDKRYLEEPELQVLTDYFTAVQNEDTEGCTSTVLDFYLQYLLDNAFGGLFDADAYVTQQHRDFAEHLGGADFTFSYLQVTDCKRQDEAGTGVDYLTDMFDTLEGEGYSKTHLEDCKTLTVQLTLTDGENSFTTESMPLYVVKIDDAYYVCP